MSIERKFLATFAIAGFLGINGLSACSGSDDESPTQSGGAGGVATGGAGGVATGGAGGIASGGTPTAGAGGGPVATGGTPAGSGGTPQATTCNTDYSRYVANGQAVSLKDDLLPIFGLSCSADACHSATGKKAGLYLGPKCDYNDTAAGGKWKCVFPTTANPDPTKPQPLTTEALAEVYANLTAAATTVNGGGTKRVVPGDPAASFLVDKIAGTENSKGFACTNQDPSHSAGSGPCGDPMPLGADPLCILGTSGPAKFDAITQWVKNGAPNN